MWQRVSLIVLGLASSACAAASSTARPVYSVSREVITAAEIVASRVTDVYQAVLQLRPEYLRRRAVPMIAAYRAPEVTVFLDDIEFGNAQSMRNIPLARVRLIRYLTPAEANIRWPGQHPGGVIHVSTLR